MRSLVVALGLAAAGLSGARAGSVVFYDDFTGPCPPNVNWTTPVMQWGGNINGGVVPGNVACAMDEKLGKQVLVLTGHGDAFTGTGPKGVDHHLTPRGSTEEWVDWKWPSYSAPCSPHCDTKRVGGAIATRQGFTGGAFEARIKPCPQFGAASAMFTYNYSEVHCGDFTKPNIKNECSPAYTAQCCFPDRTGEPGDCTINPNGKTGDVCEGVWVQNKELDFELPSSLQDGIGSVNPALISYNHTRMNTVTAFPWQYKFHCQAGVNPPYESDNFVDLGFAQNDGDYHVYRIEWVSAAEARFYVDGKLFKTVDGAKLVPDFGHLYLAQWFPNAWAGSPTFDTCDMHVDYVKISTL